MNTISAILVLKFSSKCILSNTPYPHNKWINCCWESIILSLVWSGVSKSLRMWLNYCLCSLIWNKKSLNTRQLITSAYRFVSHFMGRTVMKTLRICDCIFIQIYDRIQSPCVVITDSSFIQFFQQPDEAQQISHTVLHSTISPHNATLPHSSW